MILFLNFIMVNLIFYNISNQKSIYIVILYNISIWKNAWYPVLYINPF